MRRVYLDHAASTPLREEARSAMLAALDVTGNASSLHGSGRHARALLEDAREQLADALDAHPGEVVFTGGGTEADHLLVSGAAALGETTGRPRVAASTVEHPAVAHAVRALGERAVWLPVDRAGVLRASGLAQLTRDVAWASVMWANNETGALQPIGSFVQACRRAGVRAHSDAVQAFGHVPVSFADSGLDALTVSAHKLGGPVGVGALVLRRDAPLAVVSHGGGQERRLRSGTVPVALAVGFAVAAAASVAALAQEGPRLARLREVLVAGLTRVEGVRVNGPADVSPSICHVTVDGVRADDVLLLLDAAGIDCSTGSACTAGVQQPSEVVLAMGLGEEAATGSLRFSLGWTTTPADVTAVLDAWPAAVSRARAASA